MSDTLKSYFAAAALVCAPAGLFIGSCFLIAGHNWAAFAAFTKLGVFFYICSAAVLAGLLRDRAERTGLVGAVLFAAGCVAGACLTTARHYELALRNLPDPTTASSFASALDATHLYQETVFVPLPGLLFPIGLVVLGVGLLRAGVAGRLAPLCVILGALLFPVGRAAGIEPAYFASDILLLIGMAVVAWRVASRRVALAPLQVRSQTAVGD